MARQPNAHLSPEEIDWLVAPESAPPEGPVAEARQHLISCDACRGLVEMHQTESSRLSELKMAGAAERGPQCPEETIWARAAAGLMPAEETASCLDHASGCGHCGPLLRQATEDFSDELTPEEEATLAGLKSSRATWQRQMAQKMSRPRWSWRDWPKWAWVPVPAFAGLLVWGMVQWLQPRAPVKLLATAYTEQRTLELRFPDARHAPLRVQRGGGDRSRLDRPPALLDAEAVIARELKKHPDDVKWLEAKGRADLLEWNYESAIESFKRALEIQPDSPALMTDLASAYFERAEAADRAIDYGQAIELLGKALKAKPNDPVALFNYAIALERMFVYDQAIEAWRRYLQVDPKDDWAAEAQKRLAELDLKKHR